jgi:hypothetical protein
MVWYDADMTGEERNTGLAIADVSQLRIPHLSEQFADLKVVIHLQLIDHSFLHAHATISFIACYAQYYVYMRIEISQQNSSTKTITRRSTKRYTRLQSGIIYLYIYISVSIETYIYLYTHTH